MRKWLLLFVTVLLLAACSSEGIQKQESVPTENVVSKEDKQRELHAKQYYNVLLEAVESLGYPADGGDYESNYMAAGVYYAELVDFDGDGFDELYVLLKNHGYAQSEFSHRNVENYVHEVWSGRETGDTPELLFSYEIDAMECTACDLSVSLIDAQDGQTYIKQFSHQTRQGYVGNATSFYAKNGGTLQAVELYETGTPQDLEHYINEELKDATTFEAELAKFSGTERPIIVSEAGFKRYGYTTKSAEQVSMLLAKLSSNNNSVITGKPVAAEKSKEVHRAFDIHKSEKNIDVNEPKMRLALIFDVMMETDIPSSYDEESFTTTYRLADIAPAYKERYGVELDLSEVDLPDRSQQMFEYITFENDTFYVTATDFYYDEIKREFDAVYEVAKDLYYVVLNDQEFDVMGYYTSVENEPAPLEVDMASLPAGTESYLKKNVKRYAVVKMVDATPKLQYLGVHNLTDEELSQF